MPKNTSYPEMNAFFSGYLNQDFDLYGETVEEVIDFYKNQVSQAIKEEIIMEINKFKNEFKDNLEDAFHIMFEREIFITDSDYTAAIFLEEFKGRLLSI